jgi:hypothetical protein
VRFWLKAKQAGRALRLRKGEKLKDFKRRKTLQRRGEI